MFMLCCYRHCASTESKRRCASLGSENTEMQRANPDRCPISVDFHGISFVAIEIHVFVTTMYRRRRELTKAEQVHIGLCHQKSGTCCYPYATFQTSRYSDAFCSFLYLQYSLRLTSGCRLGQFTHWVCSKF